MNLNSESPIDSVYTSCACNRFPSCVDWGRNGLIIYAACNSVLVYRPEKHGGKVIQSLISHKKLVTSVHWIRKKHEHEVELLSTSADATAVIWSKKNSQFVPSNTLSGHSDVVKTGTAGYSNNSTDELLIATASADSTVKIWKRSNSSVECMQTISFGNGLALSVEFLFPVASSDPILVIGRDDCNVHVYVCDENNQFTSSASISGHEDWIQGLDMIEEENGTLWLASASQDCFIRIWKFVPSSVADPASPCNDSEPPKLKLKKISFENRSGTRYTISLESVLQSHSNSVYSVKWGRLEEKVTAGSLKLVSSSMDRSMIIWQPDSSSDLWIDEVRVGEVGGNVLGFYGGVFAPDEKTILAHGFQGAIHIWSYNENTSYWDNDVPFGGHFASVQDIAWDPDGAFLISCSHDQTTRLHAPIWKESKKRTWHEISRPQIHGYDIVCLSVLNRFKFVSGSDEKVLRVFHGPKKFAENLKKLCGIDTTSYIKDSLPEGASVPALGLTNKAVYEQDLERLKRAANEPKHFKDQCPEFTFKPVDMEVPPTEEVLLQNTLWPEHRKLYGHQYEIFSLASNHKGTIVASTCKAAKAEHAAIILWDASSWKKLGNLVFHSLSVTQMEFSPNDEYLVSVSRDRMWVLYKHVPGESPPYRKIAHLDKKLGIHSRIIWSCSWSHDSLYFATASRDKKVAIWKVSDSSDATDVACMDQLDVTDSATAVSFAPCASQNDRYIVAIGLENGKILIYTWHSLSETKEYWNMNFCLDQQYAHHLTVNRLKFSPVKESTTVSELSGESLLLASCGSDYHVRVTALHYSALH